MSDLPKQIDEIRESLAKLSDDVLELRRKIGPRKIPPEKWEQYKSALESIKGNVELAIKEGKTVKGEDDLLPWILRRIKDVL
jgi:hypothetical protein